MIRFTNLSRFVLALICGFAVTAASPSWADTVSVAASTATFADTSPCNVVNVSPSASCYDSNVSGTASSSANLATGTLTASASGVNINASATLTANISLALPSGYSLPTVPVMLTFNLDAPGTVSGNALIMSELSVGGQQNTIEGLQCSGNMGPCTSSPLSLTITEYLPVDQLSNILIFAEVLAETQGPGGGTAIIDPSINLILPDGVTFTSQSGIFLTAQTPLPAGLPLFATGLGGLGLLGWRRKWRKVSQ